jgi:hypothetical protein
MRRILVVGFPRSGTSLTLRILEKNPLVTKTFFEKFILFNQKEKRFYSGLEFCRMYNNIVNDTFAEKIIWEKKYQGKAYVTANISCIDYCNYWNEMFGERSRIINIVRHPIDSWNSLVKLRKKQGRIAKLDLEFQWYQDCAIELFTEIPKIENCMVLKYEDLIKNSDDVVKKIYQFCDIDVPISFDEKMRDKRVFNYKWFGVRDELKNYNFKPIIEALNTLPGVTYE